MLSYLRVIGIYYDYRDYEKYRSGFTEYIEVLINESLIKKIHINDQPYYKLTDFGKQFLKYFNKLYSWYHRVPSLDESPIYFGIIVQAA